MVCVFNCLFVCLLLIKKGKLQNSNILIKKIKEKKKRIQVINVTEKKKCMEIVIKGKLLQTNKQPSF